MAARVSPFRQTAMERYVPIARSTHSFFNPAWEIGNWHDFGSTYKAMEEHMRQMNKEIDAMFSRMERLMPLEHSKRLQNSLNAAPIMKAMPAIEPPKMSMPPVPAPVQPPVPSMAPMPVAIPPMPPMPSMSPIPDDWKLENPFVTEKDGSRKLKLQFDVRQFKPEEITVKTQDNQLTVHAQHEEKSPQGHSFREYHRQFLLPQSVQLETLSSTLSPEGVLSVSAPVPTNMLPEPSKERIIPIAHK